MPYEASARAPKTEIFASGTADEAARMTRALFPNFRCSDRVTCIGTNFGIWDIRSSVSPTPSVADPGVITDCIPTSARCRRADHRVVEGMERQRSTLRYFFFTAFRFAGAFFFAAAFAFFAFFAMLPS